MALNVGTFIISMLLFAVLFFGISFIVNMLLKTTWLFCFLYPIAVILIIDNVPAANYFTDTHSALTKLGQLLISLAPSDITILMMGFVGTIAAGVTMKMLRLRGYYMF